jgi:integrase/recombinase XerD
MQKEDKRTGKRSKKERSYSNSNQSLRDLFDLFYEAKVAEGRSPATLQQYQFNFSLFALRDLRSNQTFD